MTVGMLVEETCSKMKKKREDGLMKWTNTGRVTGALKAKRD